MREPLGHPPRWDGLGQRIALFILIKNQLLSTKCVTASFNSTLKTLSKGLGKI